MPLPMSGYVREQTTSLPTRKCLRRRDEEAFGKRLRSAAREGFFFLEFFPRFFFPSRSLRSRGLVFPSSKPKPRLLSRPLFPTRKRSLRRFVSEGEAVVTNFAPPPSTLILIRENTIRGSAVAGLTENFLPTNPPWKIRSMFSTFFNETDLFPNLTNNVFCLMHLYLVFVQSSKHLYYFLRIWNLHIIMKKKYIVLLMDD